MTLALSKDKISSAYLHNTPLSVFDGYRHAVNQIFSDSVTTSVRHDAH